MSRNTIVFYKFSLYKNLLDIQILSESYSDLDSDLDTDAIGQKKLVRETISLSIINSVA